MNILFVILKLAGGGAEKVSVNIANYCASKGDNVYFLLSDIGVYGDLISKDVEIIKVPENPLLFFIYLLIQMKNKKIDVVFSSMLIPNYFTGIAKLFYSFRLVQRQTFLIDKSFDFSLKKKVMNRIQAFIYDRLCFRVIANSEQTAIDLINYYKVQKCKIEIIGNPVFDYSIFRRAEESISLPFDSSIPYILSVGSLRMEKNYIFLLESYSHIINRCSANLLLIGSGPMKNEILEKIKKMNLNNRVFLIDFVNNPYPYYKKGRLFVSSSIKESFGNVIVEAMSFGLPIVATNTGGARYILKDGQYGIICNSFDSLEFGEIILKELQSDKSRIKENQNRAFDFSIDVMSEKYRSLFL